jgi:hypothetical protein
LSDGDSGLRNYLTLLALLEKRRGK